MYGSQLGPVNANPFGSAYSEYQPVKAQVSEETKKAATESSSTVPVSNPWKMIAVGAAIKRTPHRRPLTSGVTFGRRPTSASGSGVSSLSQLRASPLLASTKKDGDGNDFVDPAQYSSFSGSSPAPRIKEGSSMASPNASVTSPGASDATGPGSSFKRMSKRAFEGSLSGDLAASSSGKDESGTRLDFLDSATPAAAGSSLRTPMSLASTSRLGFTPASGVRPMSALTPLSGRTPLSRGLGTARKEALEFAMTGECSCPLISPPPGFSAIVFSVRFLVFTTK